MKLIYIGKGAALPDVPARDLTEQEVEKLGIERLLESGLYKLAEPPKKSKSLETVQTDGGK